MALTDALFVFLLLLALVLYVRAIRSGRLSAYALAGVATGLCQNTKYHGISVLVLVGAYLGAGWLAALLRGCAGEHRIWRQAKGLLVALAVTVAMYAPWAILVERTVGYEKLLAWTRQFTSFWHTPPAYLWDCAKTFTSPAVLVLAAVGALVAVQSRRPQARLVVLVFAAFVLAPTAYQPYPRLLLPAVALACGLAGVGVLWLFGLERKKVSGTFCRNGPKGASHKRYLTPFSWLRVAAAVLLVGWVGADALYRAVPTLVEGPAGYRRAAAALKNLPVDDEGAEIWTDVQHCMRFSMTREMRARTRRIKTAEKALDFMAPRPVRRYLAVDLRVLRYRAKAAAFLAYLDALDRADLCVQRIDNPLNDVTRLNSLSFEELGRVASAPETALGRRVREIAIYRIPAGWAPPR